MKIQRTLAILWMGAFAVLMYYWLWEFLNQIAPAYDRVHARGSLVCLFGIVACIFLFRGAKWARISMGIVALYLGADVLFTELLPRGWMREDKLADDVTFVLCLVTVVLLFFRKYEPVSSESIGPLAVRTKILAMVFLLLAALAGGYLVGFSRARSADIRHMVIHDLHVYPRLYMWLQEGNTNPVSEDLRDLTIYSYSYYQTHFSNEIVTGRFTNDLAVARNVFDQEKAAKDEWNRTNRAPDKSLQPTATAPSVSTNK